MKNEHEQTQTQNTRWNDHSSKALATNVVIRRSAPNHSFYYTYHIHRVPWVKRMFLDQKLKKNWFSNERMMYKVQTFWWVCLWCGRWWWCQYFSILRTSQDLSDPLYLSIGVNKTRGKMQLQSEKSSIPKTFLCQLDLWLLPSADTGDSFLQMSD